MERLKGGGVGFGYRYIHRHRGRRVMNKNGGDKDDDGEWVTEWAGNNAESIARRKRNYFSLMIIYFVFIYKNDICHV